MMIKLYSLIALLLFGAGLTGIGLTFLFLEPNAWIGGIAISIATFWGMAFAFFQRRKEDKRVINFK